MSDGESEHEFRFDTPDQCRKWGRGKTERGEIGKGPVSQDFEFSISSFRFGHFFLGGPKLQNIISRIRDQLGFLHRVGNFLKFFWDFCGLFSKTGCTGNYRLKCKNGDFRSTERWKISFFGHSCSFS